MKINYETYKDKVKACWIGKNIGGTIGAPYEGSRELLDVKGYTSEPGEPIPNDDLDLQLVWLHVLENEGAGRISAELLGEYWLDLITPYWNEYGISKTNMQKGLQPPTSGDYDNDWKNSNGAWIRTEVWACVAPAAPELAIKFAVEDAKVDHGTGEGTYAAAFVAAMQSAAFALSDIRECIDVAFKSIPETSRTHKSVRAVIECFDSGKSWVEARNTVLEMNRDIGSGWFEAPSNVAYTVIGLLYGKNDFKQSVLIATNCGDDTDCTAGTAGATLGILFGTSVIPEDWRAYIGDRIITVATSAVSVGRTFPKTCSELSERICALAPGVLYSLESRFEAKIGLISTSSFGENTQSSAEIFEELTARTEAVRKEHLMLKENSVEFEKAFLRGTLSAQTVSVTPNSDVKLELDLTLRSCVQLRQHSLEFRWILPDGFSIEGPLSATVKANEYQHKKHGTGKLHLDFILHTGDTVAPRSRCVLEITSPGRHTAIYTSIVFMG